MSRAPGLPAMQLNVKTHLCDSAAADFPHGTSGVPLISTMPLTGGVTIHSPYASGFSYLLFSEREVGIPDK
jgi:hypothetical protein